jgi:transposase
VHYRQYAKRLKRSLRQIHKAGEKLFIDFAGPTVELSDGGRVHIFVAALGASGYTYACATPSETMMDWLSSTALGHSPSLEGFHNSLCPITHAH